MNGAAEEIPTQTVLAVKESTNSRKEEGTTRQLTTGVEAESETRPPTELITQGFNELLESVLRVVTDRSVGVVVPPTVRVV